MLSNGSLRITKASVLQPSAPGPGVWQCCPEKAEEEDRMGSSQMQCSVEQPMFACDVWGVACRTVSLRPSSFLSCLAGSFHFPIPLRLLHRHLVAACTCGPVGACCLLLYKSMQFVRPGSLSFLFHRDLDRTSRRMPRILESMPSWAFVLCRTACRKAVS